MPLVDRLNAGAVVHVRDGGHRAARDVDPPHQVGVTAHGLQLLGRERAAMLLQHRSNHEHVRRILMGSHLEPLVDVLAQHAGSKGPEALPELDLEVHDRLHLRRPRVTDDTTRAQSPRAVLHPAVEPADHLLLGHGPSDVLEQLRLVAKIMVTSSGLVEKLLDLARGILRPQEAALLCILAVGRPWLVQQLVPDEQGSPQSAAGIAGGGLNPDVLERPFTQQPAVGDAVERHATRHHEVLHPGLAVQLAPYAQHDLLGHFLDAGRQVHVPLLQPGVRLARRSAEELVESLIGHRQTLAVVEVVHVQPKTAVRLEVDEVLVDGVLVDRLAVRSQTHQLVLAAVDPEAAVVRESRVEQTQRVRELQVVSQSKRVARPGPVGSCAPLADAVQGEDGGVFEGAGKECAGGVALMVVHKDQRGLDGVGEPPADLAAHEQLLLEPQGHGLGEAPEAARSVAAVCLQQAFELGERLVVKRHVVKLRRQSGPPLADSKRSPARGIARHTSHE